MPQRTGEARVKNQKQTMKPMSLQATRHLKKGLAGVISQYTFRRERWILKNLKTWNLKKIILNSGTHARKLFQII